MSFCKLLITCLLFASTAYAVNEQQAHMLRELDFIYHSFKTSYAPAEWKKQYAQWDIEEVIAETRKKVEQNENITVKEFQILLKQLFNSAKDYHVGISFYSTEYAILPFIVRSANERYFFSYIDREGLADPDEFPFAVGDELLFFNQEPVHEVVRTIKDTEFGDNHYLTDMAMAETYLTTRLGAYGHDIPQGNVTLTGCRQGSTELVTYEMPWSYMPEIISTAFAAKAKLAVKVPVLESKIPFSHKSFVWPQYNMLARARRFDVDPIDIEGTKKSFIPHLGKVLWEEVGDFFHAYLFEMSEGKVGGYVRIPDYQPDLEDLDLGVAEFGQIIKHLQKNADVLVIDQVNNPGGYAVYMYSLASMLTDKPLSVPRHRQLITQEDVFFAFVQFFDLETVDSDQEARDILGDTFQGLHVTHEVASSLVDFMHFLIDQWERGNYFCDPYYLYGLTHIPPHPLVQFTKPILILVNEQDISAGDFFPAIMQDNGRAKILGRRTGGAGGYVVPCEFKNLSGISMFSLTGSIAYRQNDLPIENNGVTPDIYYALSVTDRQNNYVEYCDKIVSTLISMTENVPEISIKKPKKRRGG